MEYQDKPILVVKVGTSVLVDITRPNTGAFVDIADAITQLREAYNIVLVTSGAVGFGMKVAQVERRPTEIHALQALSMIGQKGLLGKWQDAFGAIEIGQVLLTRRELGDQRIVRQLQASIMSLWQFGAIPIVNENDAISNEEFGFSDNDQLAALLSGVLEAKTLVLLTNQDGIRQNFGLKNESRLAVSSVDEALTHINDSISEGGKGGALSKVRAAQEALKYDVTVHIARVDDATSIEQAIHGEVGTTIVE